MDSQSFRDMCAAMAMQGLLSRNNALVNAAQTATVAFDVADAMAAERQRREAAKPRVVPS